MAFADFRNIQQAKGSYSCGGYALAAALCNLTPTNQLPTQLKEAKALETQGLKGYNRAYDPGIFSKESLTSFAESIYKITGNLELVYNQYSAIYQYYHPATSSPSALVHVASLFDNTGQRISFNFINNSIGKIVYSSMAVELNDDEIRLFDAEIMLMGEIKINEQDNYQPPTTSQTHLILVNRGLHWIAINHNQLYDPETGYLGTYIISPDNLTLNLTEDFENKKEQYDISGMWIQMG